MGRTKESQSKHNSMVRKLAREYINKGYDADADILGYTQPGTILGLRPDLRVRKGSHETVIEVETKDSVDSKRDIKQQKAFKNWSKGSPLKHYRMFVTEE